MHRHTLTAAAAVAIAALTLTGCGSDSSTDDTSPGPSTASTSADDTNGGDAADEPADYKNHIKIVKHGVEDHDVWGPDSYVVHYKVTNNGDDAASYYAGLEFLDSDGDGKSKSGDTSPLPVEIENGEITDIKDVRVTEVDRTDPA